MVSNLDWIGPSNSSSESGKSSGSYWEVSGVGVDCSGVGIAAASVAKASKAWQKSYDLHFPVLSMFAPQRLDQI